LAWPFAGGDAGSYPSSILSTPSIPSPTKNAQATRPSSSHHSVAFFLPVERWRAMKRSLEILLAWLTLA
jgi:hypothetical protein